jgi:fructokinase
MTVLLGGIEAGGTKFICAAARNPGEFLAQTRIPTGAAAATLAAAQQFFEAVTAEHGALSSLGIASFGPLDLRNASPTFGRILGTPKQGWADTDLGAPFARRFGCPVAIDTDVNAAALAETLHGAARGCSTAVYVTVGTGIGGGAVIDGRTLRGSPHPEMGHIRVARHARDAAFAGVCPFHGDCLEGVASGPAIVARYGVPLEALPSDHEAIAIVGHYLGQLAANVLLMISPERLILGGGVMSSEPLLVETRAAAARLLNGYGGYGASAAPLDRTIVAPGLGERSGIVGALVLADQALQWPLVGKPG